MKHPSYQHFMQGVTYLVPFLMAAGLLMGMTGFIQSLGEFEHPILKDIDLIVPLLYQYMIPVIAAFIAYSIADKPGFVIGFIGGLFAVIYDSGIISAILLGFLGGYLTHLCKLMLKKTPKSFNSLKSMVFIPLIALIIFIPLAYLSHLFLPLLSNQIQMILSIDQGYLLFIICGLSAMFMAYDMGGPVNKIMYMLALISIARGEPTQLMAAVMVGGMVPPLGIYWFGLLFSKKMNEEDLKLSKNNLILGLSFVTEGAIYFANKDKKAVMPAILIGSLVSGLLIAGFQVKLSLPHGGIFATLFIQQWWGFLLALLLGTFITSLLLLIRWKKHV